MTIDESMRIEWRDTAGLIPYAGNARTHSDEQVARIAASIREFGWTNPVLIDDRGGIIAGHGRLAAARLLGIDRVPCIRLSQLTDAQRRAYVLADNRLALDAGWDEQVLAAELARLSEDGFELTLTGFDQAAIDGLLKSPDFDPVGADEQGKLDEIATKRCPNCGHEL